MEISNRCRHLLIAGKTLSMDSVNGLPIATDYGGHSYDSILVIFDRADENGRLRAGAENVVVRHQGLPDSIVKFLSSLCYFLGIKFTAFHPQTDGQTERPNSRMEAYLRTFVNFE